MKADALASTPCVAVRSAGGCQCHFQRPRSGDSPYFLRLFPLVLYPIRLSQPWQTSGRPYWDTMKADVTSLRERYWHRGLEQKRRSSLCFIYSQDGITIKLQPEHIIYSYNDGYTSSLLTATQALSSLTLGIVEGPCYVLPAGLKDFHPTGFEAIHRRKVGSEGY